MDLPHTVKGYRLVREIAKTQLSYVYEAEVVGSPTHERVAVKRIFYPVQIRGIQEEFSVLRELQHPNLPHYRDVFEKQGHGYLVMEFISGQNLTDVLNKHKGPLPEVLVRSYAVQLCDVLSYLHRHSVYHRDIKPANIRLTPYGLIKLVDFGLLKQGTGVTQSIRRLLTRNYAPPEQWPQYQKDFGHTDQRSDIYSLAGDWFRWVGMSQLIKCL